MSDLLQVTDANFQQEVAKSAVPVLLDFWATWCGPCKMIAPIVEDLAKDNAGKLKVAKVDVDQAQALAGNYGIRSIPTLLLFKGGAVIGQFVGVTSKAELQKMIDKAY
jgi:thioredoxin 1